MKDLGEASINLNLPPVTRNLEVVNQDPLMDNILSGNNFIKVTESENTSVDSQPKDQEMNFPINDSLIIDNGGVSSTMTSLPPLGPGIFSVPKSTEMETDLASIPAGPAVSSGYPTVGSDTGVVDPISYPTVDFAVMPQHTVVSAAPLPWVPVVQPSGSATQEVSDEQEQVLMKDLEDMGFKQPDLNKEVLRRNNYDLEKSIDALCGVSDWDPMLDELQEMVSILSDLFS